MIGFSAAVLLALLAAAPPPTPTPRAGCPDQVAVLLPKLEPLIEEFKEERDAAYATSRVSLGPMIARMRDVFKRTKALEEWPEPFCGYDLREKLHAAENHDLEVIVAFQERGSIRRRPELWQDADRQLARLKDLAAATRRQG